MTIQYIETPIQTYGSVVIEIAPSQQTAGLESLGVSNGGVMEPLGFSESVADLGGTLARASTAAFDRVKDAVVVVAHGFRNVMAQVQPDEGSIEFGVSLHADAGVVVSRIGTEATFQITLTWKKASDQVG